MYGLCILSVIPLRSEPKEASEQISQLIFGDTFAIIEEKSEWAFIELTFDNYKGWISKKQYIEITQEEHFVLTKSKPLYTSWPITRVKIENLKTSKTHTINVPIGSRLLSKSYRVNSYKIEMLEGDLISPLKISKQNLEEITNLFDRVPYLWGGKSIFGIDCSGFSQTIFKFFNKNLLRDASMQITQGEKIANLSQAKAGDLAFFCSESGKITHVGILLSNSKIVHASGFVRTDRIDEKGIIREEDKTYSHTLCQINRYF
jgi:cell wall-associated NlpC family hydrolase